MVGTDKIYLYITIFINNYKMTNDEILILLLLHKKHTKPIIYNCFKSCSNDSSYSRIVNDENINNSFSLNSILINDYDKTSK